MKSKVDKLGVDKLVPVPVDLNKLSNVVKNDVVKRDVCNDNIKNIEDKIPDITNLATKNTLNAKINEVKGEIPSTTNLATNPSLKRLKVHSQVWDNFLATGRPLKMIKNAFYFTSKALFVLKISKFLSWHFSHVSKQFD